MTLAEIVQEHASTIEVIPMPEWHRKRCEHRVTASRWEFNTDGRFIKPISTKEYHMIEPSLAMFPFSEHGLLFDIHIKYWYCEAIKHLTLAHHPAIEANSNAVGMLQILPRRFDDEFNRLLFLRCPCCTTQESVPFVSLIEADDAQKVLRAAYDLIMIHIANSHHPEVRKVNADLRELYEKFGPKNHSK